MSKLYVKSANYINNTTGLASFFQAKQLRRIDNLQKLALYAAVKTLSQAGIDLKAEKEDIGLIIATAKGPVKQVCAFMDSIIYDGDVLASPLAFSASVHNSFETVITRLLNFRGHCITISDGANSFESALITAESWLQSKRCKDILLCIIDEINPVTLEQYKNKIHSVDAAAAFVFTLDENNAKLIVNTKEADEFNPSMTAFNLSKQYSQFVSQEETSRIVKDYIKTYIAGSKTDVMSVFENQDIEKLITGFAQKEKVFEGLKLLCSLDDNIESIKTHEKQCFKSMNDKKRINFFTSGSSGVAKNCIHSKDMIDEEVEGLSFLFIGVNRIVATVPAHHSYGFIFTLKMPDFLKVPIVMHPPIPFLDWGKLLQENDLLVSFPLFLQYLADLDFKFPKSITILTSTAPCPDALIEKLYANGVEKVIEIYGASESGAIAFRQKAGSSFELLPFWNFTIENKTIKEIQRKNTTLKIEVPDITKLDGERSFFVIGRKDNAVQVAGVNVFPTKVERILKTHPFINDVIVRLGKGRLKAFIVLKDNIDVQEAQKSVYQFIKSSFTTHEMPKKITFGNKLPLTPFGKKADWD
ncbi:beta-ketoacyl synthase chain length factor [Endomicrobium proavitum]|nr:beta-ketoacyl synthase chain length factor [Endomicrobium proavitum]